LQDHSIQTDAIAPAAWLLQLQQRRWGADNYISCSTAFLCAGAGRRCVSRVAHAALETRGSRNGRRAVPTLTPAPRRYLLADKLLLQRVLPPRALAVLLALLARLPAAAAPQGATPAGGGGAERGAAPGAPIAEEAPAAALPLLAQAALKLAQAGAPTPRRPLRGAAGVLPDMNAACCASQAGRLLTGQLERCHMEAAWLMTRSLCSVLVSTEQQPAWSWMGCPLQRRAMR
jgi:hypothetical protein